ncbi:Metallo-dependent phosphatase [Aureobasidium subglaciale]|nr:Metallo-dependent phosphatase [Aureobasidium subglaciale]
MFSPFAPPSPFEPPSLLYLFLLSPPKFLLRTIHGLISLLRSSPSLQANLLPIRVICLSDTHFPDGDLLIHAGDLTQAGTPKEIQAQLDWLNTLPHAHKVVIAGNHDTYLDPRSRTTLPSSDVEEASLNWGNIHYLQHSTTTLTFPTHRNRTLKIHGAPQIPACGGPEFAFQYPRGQDAWYDTVPSGVDVLVTHTPSKHHLDLYGLGCEHLLRELWRVKPRLHIFGHVHAGRGKEVLYWDDAQKAFEDGCSRPDGLVWSMVDFWLWIDVVKTLWHGVSSVIWDRVWGGEARSTRLINASVMYINTGQLKNAPQVVEIR